MPTQPTFEVVTPAGGGGLPRGTAQHVQMRHFNERALQNRVGVRVVVGGAGA